MATRDVVFSANVDGNGGSGKEPPGSGDSFGDKSTIPMQEITHNSFVHLPDDQNDLDQNMDVVNANTQTPAGQYDMVPETQLEVQMVTT
ncbi:hypothetical protein JHK82_012212 [Glycine max]|nr:hypothetical protein JHK82_012212 [Glycine max]